MWAGWYQWKWSRCGVVWVTGGGMKGVCIMKKPEDYWRRDVCECGLWVKGKGGWYVVLMCCKERKNKALMKKGDYKGRNRVLNQVHSIKALCDMSSDTNNIWDMANHCISNHCFLFLVKFALKPFCIVHCMKYFCIVHCLSLKNNPHCWKGGDNWQQILCNYWHTCTAWCQSVCSSTDQVEGVGLAKACSSNQSEEFMKDKPLGDANTLK